MAEEDDTEGTLLPDAGDDPKPGETSNALRKLWEATETAVDVIIRRNKAHDQEKVAEFAALRVSEIAKHAAQQKAKTIVEEIKKRSGEGTPFVKEDKTSLPNNKGDDKILLSLRERRSVDENTSSKETSVAAEEPRPDIVPPWIKVKRLGKGAYGVVHLGRDKKGLEFAAKEVLKDGTVDKALQAEIEFLVRLSHKNIVRYYGHESTEEKLYMFMELMKGSIKDKLDEGKKSLSSRIARKYTKEILNGLIFLHQHDVIHRDIKCANVLLDADDTAKLADMGVSKVHETVTVTAQEGRAGSFHWMAPEVMEAKGGGRRSDVWSLGCTVYEMVKQNPPFWEIQGYVVLYQLVQKIMQKEHRTLVLSHEEIDHRLQRFLLSIFVERNDRPYAEDLVKDAWLR